MWIRRIHANSVNTLNWVIEKFRTPNHDSMNPNLLNPPDSLKTMNSRFLIFLAFCSVLIGFVWLSVCVSLYVVGVEYHVINILYEARWLLCTVIFCGFSSASLVVWKNETSFVVCAFTSLYSCASCIVTIVVYSMNFKKSLYLLHPQIHSRMAGHPRRKYLQLCGCMIVIAVLGLFICVGMLFKLWRLASFYYAKIVLNRSQKIYLLFSALMQIPLVWFSIFVTLHVISLPFSFVHQYMIQELLCAFILLWIILLQSYHYVQANRLTLILLMILNGCQTVQEIFYAWNSYYISLYIHTTKAKLVLGAEMDQYLMSANFVAHFVRMSVAAYSTHRISVWVKAPFVNAYCRLDLDRRAKQALVTVAAWALLLAAGHVIMDVVYTVSGHIYRTIIAFTGISVFYLSLIGISLALFIRTGNTLLLIIASVFMLLLSAVSIFALYVYVDTSFHNSMLQHLENLGKDQRQSSYMHFTESVLSVFALILCTIGGVFVFRLLHIDSSHDRRDLSLRKPVLCLFVLGIIQLELTTVNSALIISIKDDTIMFQSVLAYGVLDSISMFVLCLTQIYVCRPGNNHIGYGLTALLLFLICESLTAYNYLSTKTIYIQLLIVFNQMFSNSSAMKHNIQALFPPDEIGLMISVHVVQLLQWIITVISTVISALALERLHEQRNQLSSMPSGGFGQFSGAIIPAVSYKVGIRKANPNPDKLNPANKPKSDVRSDMHADTSNGSTPVKGVYENAAYDEEPKRKNSKKHDLEHGELLPQPVAILSETGENDEKLISNNVNTNEDV